MYKIGTDMVEIKRIAKSIKNDLFIKRVFGSSEIFELQKRPVESYASAFAIKEAFGKALGTGVRGFKLNEVELLHNNLGAPYLHFTGNAKKIVDQTGLTFTVSITHTKDIACATVFAYKS